MWKCLLILCPDPHSGRADQPPLPFGHLHKATGLGYSLPLPSQSNSKEEAVVKYLLPAMEDSSLRASIHLFSHKQNKTEAS